MPWFRAMERALAVRARRRPSRQASNSPEGGGLPLPGPLLDRFRQRPPEAQFHLEPRVLQPTPQYEGVGGTGEFGREVLDPDVSISRCAMVVAHE